MNVVSTLLSHSMCPSHKVGHRNMQKKLNRKETRNKHYCKQHEVSQDSHHGRLEAASRKTRSLDFESPSIWTRSSVFMRRLPSCSLRQTNNTFESKIIILCPSFITACQGFSLGSGQILFSYLVSLMAGLLLHYSAFQFVIRITSPIHFKQIDSNRFDL